MIGVQSYSNIFPPFCYFYCTKGLYTHFSHKLIHKHQGKLPINSCLPAVAQTLVGNKLFIWSGVWLWPVWTEPQHQETEHNRTCYELKFWIGNDFWPNATICAAALLICVNSERGRSLFPVHKEKVHNSF